VPLATRLSHLNSEALRLTANRDGRDTEAE